MENSAGLVAVKSAPLFSSSSVATFVGASVVTRPIDVLERPVGDCGNVMVLPIGKVSAPSPESVSFFARRRAGIPSPADCVKFAITYLLKDSLPGLVFSGINSGHNLGVAAVYSGTVAGAREGALFGLPAVALSVLERDEAAADYALAWTRERLESGAFSRVKPGCVWNVNFPPSAMGAPKGLKVARMGLAMYEDGYSPSEMENRYTLSGGKPAGVHAPDTDDWAVEQGWISLCPLQVDQTDDEELERLSAGAEAR